MWRARALKFANPQVGHAKRFNDYVDTAATQVRTSARRRGVLNGADVQTLCPWKWKRRAALAKNNSDAFTREVTMHALGGDFEQTRIGGLLPG